MRRAKNVSRKHIKPRLQTPVCKPCWELKYCPYGPLVEYFPLVGPEPNPLPEVKRLYRSVLRAVADGECKTEEDIHEAMRRLEILSPERWEYITQYQTDELQCNVFGHMCPVFFMWEGATETKTYRRHSRRIPRDVMLKVVRRDQSICQICFEPVPDNEVQFDHVIPHSRGGPASPDNLRLVHARCNNRKRDSLSEILRPR